ncbi:hypothetical protein SAMN02910263_03941 [Butyrivibrio sp. INlla16]|nr:hypothetical protein SAMN02910263_03941 [Butyrivibrio sp. INlla16]
MPFSSEYWWFATVYIFLYLMTPSINQIVNLISKKWAYIVSFLFFILWYVVVRALGTYYCMIQGAIVFYVIGGLIGEKKLLCGCFMELSNTVRGAIYGIMIFILSCVLCVIYFEDMNSFIEKGLVGVICPIISICLFLFFRNLSISKSEWINVISRTVFGIYLFHCSDAARILMWKYTLLISKMKVEFCIIAFVAGAIIVFILGVCMDLLRERLFGLVHRKRMAE